MGVSAVLLWPQPSPAHLPDEVPWKLPYEKVAPKG